MSQMQLSQTGSSTPWSPTLAPLVSSGPADLLYTSHWLSHSRPAPSPYQHFLMETWTWDTFQGSQDPLSGSPGPHCILSP